MKPRQKYEAFRSHPAWSALEKALVALAANDDVELRTAKRYVVGYLLDSLDKKHLLLPRRPAKNGRALESAKAHGRHFANSTKAMNGAGAARSHGRRLATAK